MKLHFPHPYPRYGFAAALVRQGIRPEDVTTWQEVVNLAIAEIQHGLERFSLSTSDNPELETTSVLRYDWVAGVDLAPGKASGQIAARGYFLAPHVLTSDGSAANTVKESRDLLAELQKCASEKNLYKNCKLMRSFAPLTSKVNNGNKSALEPPASLRDAAFTCIATLTRLKPALYTVSAGSFFNAAIIPDLPLTTPDGNQPLMDFIDIFDKMQPEGDESRNLMEAHVKPDKRKYERPRLHYGNFPNPPADRSLNAVALVTAIGQWAREQKRTQLPYVRKVLNALAEKPLYVISYEGTQQERFGHHLATLALEEPLSTVQKAFRRTQLYGAEKLDDPKRLLFQRAATQFLQFYTAASFQDFLAFRSEYPFELIPLFVNYFTHIMATEHFSPDLIEAARAFGQSINNAAYRTALAKVEEDRKAERRGLTIEEHKARILTEIESRVFSAESKSHLFSQISVTVGRMTGADFAPKAGEFIVLALSDENISREQVKNLITAFMRLRGGKRAEPQQTGNAGSEPLEIEHNVVEDLELDD